MRRHSDEGLPTGALAPPILPRNWFCPICHRLLSTEERAEQKALEKELQTCMRIACTACAARYQDQDEAQEEQRNDRD